MPATKNNSRSPLSDAVNDSSSEELFESSENAPVSSSLSKKDISVPTSFDDGSLCTPYSASCRDSKPTSPKTANLHQTSTTTTFSYRPAELLRNQSQVTSVLTPVAHTLRPTLTVSSTTTPPIQVDQVAVTVTRTNNVTNNVVTPPFHQALPKISSKSLPSFNTNQESPGRIAVSSCDSTVSRDGVFLGAVSNANFPISYRGRGNFFNPSSSSNRTAMQSVTKKRTITTESTRFSYIPSVAVSPYQQGITGYPVSRLPESLNTSQSSAPASMSTPSDGSKFPTRQVKSNSSNVLNCVDKSFSSACSISSGLPITQTGIKSTNTVLNSFVRTRKHCLKPLNTRTEKFPKEGRSSCQNIPVVAVINSEEEFLQNKNAWIQKSPVCSVANISGSVESSNMCSRKRQPATSVFGNRKNDDTNIDFTANNEDTQAMVSTSVENPILTSNKSGSNFNTNKLDMQKNSTFDRSESNSYQLDNQVNVIKLEKQQKVSALARCQVDSNVSTKEVESQYKATVDNLGSSSCHIDRKVDTSKVKEQSMFHRLTSISCQLDSNVNNNKDETQQKSTFDCPAAVSSPPDSKINTNTVETHLKSTVECCEATSCKLDGKINTNKNETQQKSTFDNSASTSCQLNSKTYKTSPGVLIADSCSDNENGRVKTTVNSAQAPVERIVKVVPNRVGTSSLTTTSNQPNAFKSNSYFIGSRTLNTLSRRQNSLASSAIDHSKGSSTDGIDNADQMPLRIKTSSCSNSDTFKASLTTAKASALSLTCSVPPLSASSSFKIGKPFQVKPNKEITTCSVKTPNSSVQALSYGLTSVKVAPSITNVKPIYSTLALESKTGKDGLPSMKEAKIQTSISMFTSVAQPVDSVNNVALSTNKGCVSSSTTVSSGKTNYSPMPVLVCMPPVPPKPVAYASVVKERIVLSWDLPGGSLTPIDNYEVYSYIAEDLPHLNGANPWRRISSLKAKQTPMSCVLTEFEHGLSYYFAVRAIDIYGRGGHKSLPCMVKAETKK